MSPSQLKAVLEYMQAQREHHRTRSFPEEYRELRETRESISPGSPAFAKLQHGS